MATLGFKRTPVQIAKRDATRRAAKKEAIKTHKEKLDKWALARSKEKSNVGEYKT